MQAKDLKQHARNPRKISEEQLNALHKSMIKYGDLSGFVWNRRTQQLISGNQKQKKLPPDSKIVIKVRHSRPTAAFTIAEGYVVVGKERFKYREVDADQTWEMEALIAANKHGGEWDNDALKLIKIDFPKMNMELAGLELPEISLKPKRKKKEETDEQYVKNTPKTAEQIPIENISTAKPKEKIQAGAVWKLGKHTLTCGEADGQCEAMLSFYTKLTGLGTFSEGKPHPKRSVKSSAKRVRGS